MGCWRTFAGCCCPPPYRTKHHKPALTGVPHREFAARNDAACHNACHQTQQQNTTKPLTGDEHREFTSDEH